ncbi:MAG: winged helix-turn-helix domain-containing protein, partial [Prevotellaceae bacterium]|nr:winged helix-turn-helix domain-containing protein [Prevotellaceae bacterium]
YNVSFKQIRNWINRFDAEGTQGLLDKARSGRPRKLTENHLYELQSVLLDSPEQHGYNTANWSAALVKDFISKHYEVEYMLAKVYRIMHSLGFSYQKARGFFPARNEQQREQAKTDIKKL